MEFNRNKIQMLVDNLQFYLDRNAGVAQLLPIVQMLMAELQPSSNENFGLNISVVTPVQNSIYNYIKTITEIKNTFLNLHHKEELPLKIMKVNSMKLLPPAHFNTWDDSGIVQEALTIIRRNAAEDDNKKIVMNDYYTLPQNNLLQALQAAPVKDLTKDIENDDRDLFISKLFLSDEDMYNRCLITLNNFDSYRQASNWAERELHLKLGWDASNALVQEFDELIKLRYAAA